MKINFESKPVYGDDERQMPKKKHSVNVYR